MIAIPRSSLDASAPAAPAGRLLFRSDLLTVRDAAPLERCAARHQLAFAQPWRASPRLRVESAPPRRAEPTRVLLVTAGDAPPRTALGQSFVVFGFARDVRAFTRTQATVAPRALLELHVLRAALAAGTVASSATPNAAAPDAMAVEEAALGLLRHALAAPSQVDGLDAGARRRREIVDAARDMLGCAPGAPHHLADVARALGISPSHLAHVFRAEMEMPLHRYLLHLRLAVALERLVDGGPHLSALALDLGFATHSHFSAAFRRWCGVAPAAARTLLSREPAATQPIKPRAALAS